MMIAVDTNLLLLYIVGKTRLSFVERHKRLSAYRQQDFFLLAEQLDTETILLIPNTLSEVSNLLVQGVANPLRDALRASLASMIAERSEIYVPSEAASMDAFFAELGLTDCALLVACADGARLLTVDVKLYVAGCRRGIDTVNFNHLRDSTF